MGRSITAHAAQHGYNIRLMDINTEALEQAKKFILGALKRAKDKENQGLVTFHDNLAETLESAELIIEAIPEVLELKKKIFTEIDKISPPEAIIATNSSSIPISKIEDAVERKDKVLNLHFYAPISVRNMVDIMRGTQTSDETFELGKKWVESINCEPLIVKKECLGFVFNRIWRAVKKECLKIWDGGYADIETVDKAWRIFTKMAFGPFQMMDGVGLDVVYDIEMSYYNESGDSKDKPPEKLKEMVEKGELGFKTKKGFYNYGRKRKK